MCNLARDFAVSLLERRPVPGAWEDGRRSERRQISVMGGLLKFSDVTAISPSMHSRARKKRLSTASLIDLTFRQTIFTDISTAPFNCG